MSNDNRMFERLEVDLPARFKGSPGEHGGRMSLLEISAQGARLVSKERFFVNDFVALEVLMPLTGEIVELQGQVVWISTLEPQTSWNVGLTLEGERLMKLENIKSLWKKQNLW